MSSEIFYIHFLLSGCLLIIQFFLESIFTQVNLRISVVLAAYTVNIQILKLRIIIISFREISDCLSFFRFQLSKVARKLFS